MFLHPLPKWAGCQPCKILDNRSCRWSSPTGTCFLQDRWAVDREASGGLGDSTREWWNLGGAECRLVGRVDDAMSGQTEIPIGGRSLGETRWCLEVKPWTVQSAASAVLCCSSGEYAQEDKFHGVGGVDLDLVWGWVKQAVAPRFSLSTPLTLALTPSGKTNTHSHTHTPDAGISLTTTPSRVFEGPVHGLGHYCMIAVFVRHTSSHGSE
jgi:hypothetical protein